MNPTLKKDLLAWMSNIIFGKTPSSDLKMEGLSLTHRVLQEPEDPRVPTESLIREDLKLINSRIDMLIALSRPTPAPKPEEPVFKSKYGTHIHENDILFHESSGICYKVCRTPEGELAIPSMTCPSTLWPLKRESSFLKACCVVAEECGVLVEKDKPVKAAKPKEPVYRDCIGTTVKEGDVLWNKMIDHNYLVCRNSDGQLTTRSAGGNRLLFSQLDFRSLLETHHVIAHRR